MTLAKIIPNNVDAEQAVLGGLMLDSTSERAAKVFSMLKPESFYTFEHGKIFSEMLFLAKNNQPIDLMTMDSRLTATGNAEQLGGFAYLAELANNTPSAANILAYADLVRDAAIKRFAIKKLQDCEALMFAQSNLSATERIDAISRLMAEIADYGRTGKSGGLRSSREVGNEWLNEFELRRNEPELTRGLSTGLTALDDLLGKKLLVKQSLAVVGARPKAGKTAFYSLIAGNCVMREKKTALLFSLEMSATQIFERMLGQTTNVTTDVFYLSDKELAQYNMTTQQLFGKVTGAMGQLVQDDLLYIDDTPNVSMAHIRNECRRIKRERGEIGLIGVDYLTLMKAEEAERNDLAYGKITKELKALAREMDCVVLLLTQLNRNLENRADKRPQPSDSRDTGQIEQDCDYWFGLYKESVYNPDADKQLTEVIVRLNRHGGTGVVYAEQRFGAMFNCDQQDAERRAMIGKPAPKQKSYPKGDF